MFKWKKRNRARPSDQKIRWLIWIGPGRRVLFLTFFLSPELKTTANTVILQGVPLLLPDQLIWVTKADRAIIIGHPVHNFSKSFFNDPCYVDQVPGSRWTRTPPSWTARRSTARTSATATAWGSSAAAGSTLLYPSIQGRLMDTFLAEVRCCMPIALSIQP